MNIENQYLELLEEILEKGVKKDDRTGTGTISIFGKQLRHKMSEGFPLLTTKKMQWNKIMTELFWFIQGRTDLKWLLELNNHIWVGDAYKAYLEKIKTLDITENNIRNKGIIKVNKINGNIEEFDIIPYSKSQFIDKIKEDSLFSKEFGNLGPIYGKQWRNWDITGAKEHTTNDSKYDKSQKIDQLNNCINMLINNPDSRRILVSAWRPDQLDDMVLPPCHYGFQFYTRELSLIEKREISAKRSLDKIDDSGIEALCEKGIIPKRAISLMWNQRSVDVALGLPFNIASYGLLLEIFAKTLNMVPDELICNLGDTHIYQNHIEGIKEQLTRKPYDLPKLNINTEWWPTKTESVNGEIDPIKLLESFSSDDFCKCLIEEDIQLSEYKHHSPIKFPLSN